ncbi:hypothetical protein wKueTS_10220 [Wolbachia pipientis]
MSISKTSATSTFDFPFSTKDTAFSLKSTLYTIAFPTLKKHIIPLSFAFENTIVSGMTVFQIVGKSKSV